jgi:hypothetical protein
MVGTSESTLSACSSMARNWRMWMIYHHESQNWFAHHCCLKNSGCPKMTNLIPKMKLIMHRWVPKCNTMHNRTTDSFSMRWAAENHPAKLPLAGEAARPSDLAPLTWRVQKDFAVEETHLEHPPPCSTPEMGLKSLLSIPFQYTKILRPPMDSNPGIDIFLGTTPHSYSNCPCVELCWTWRCTCGEWTFETQGWDLWVVKNSKLDSYPWGYGRTCPGKDPSNNRHEQSFAWCEDALVETMCNSGWNISQRMPILLVKFEKITRSSNESFIQIRPLESD